MWPFSLFVLYLLIVFVIAALLEYPLYLLANQITDISFSKISGDLVIPVGLAGLYFFLRSLGLNNKQALGYDVPRRRFIALIVLGFLAGLLIILPLVGSLLVLDIRILKSSTDLWANLGLTALEALIAGLIVALIEETFFRGALFSAVYRREGLMPAAILSGLLYALTHFIDTDFHITQSALGWQSGLILLSHSFEDFNQPGKIIDSLSALFAIGVFLSLVRARTGTIALCIGMHAGWVFIIKLAKSISYADPSAQFAWLVGTYDSIIGWLVFVWLGILTLFFYRWALANSDTST